ncbi:hypothetical protein DTL21_23850 [Bremerella cremea]|uniref:Uncharacterized protein n=1 Tax=Blastopirellula marina TaxID=124 RepID=A0A2S8FE06_9BACT|nr:MULTISPECIES: hypothetical protein [Pirellulaceae]PQO30395.1 hypothetical protein C5Y83_23810 [Blastopirellula marina]RCS43747.1 hypothetical protein DTL21_23850 [Bremerella cremea]
MIQRFSLTKIFVFTALVALSCLVVRQAFMGADWAKGLSFVFAAAILWCAIHFVLGLLGYFAMKLRELLVPPKAQSPFATDTPAPQIIPPKNIERD